jgi:hypothetical protein
LTALARQPPDVRGGPPPSSRQLDASPATVNGQRERERASASRSALETAGAPQSPAERALVQKYAGTHFSDDPTFNAQRARIIEGLRKAGLPEGDKTTD